MMLSDGAMVHVTGGPTCADISQWWHVTTVSGVDGWLDEGDASAYKLEPWPDVLDRPVVRPGIKETTALGAAYAAGLAVGFYKGVDDLRANWAIDHTWHSNLESERREQMYRLWKKAVTRSFDWVE